MKLVSLFDSTPRKRPRRGPVARLAIGVTVAATTAALATAAGSMSATAAPYGAGRGNVQANLFEWNWKSIALECVNVLGPAGYGGVQVAPPQDSVKRQALGDGSDTVLHPWWEVYQPVDYNLTSRMGTEAEFKSMVTTCRRAGVKVYVDAVINHMTGQGSVSYGGKTYSHYDYTGLYGPTDFHVPNGDCPTTGGIDDFNNQAEVFNCELVGLADLDTGLNYVRTELAGYLNKLIGYGVSGFRVDAAKHIGQTDLDAIYSRLHSTLDGQRPQWALEVFGGGPGTLSPQAFVRSGTVLGLDGVKQIQSAFKSYEAAHVGSISTLKDFGTNSGLTPSNKTLTFVENHDTERDVNNSLSYNDGARNILANEFILGYNYGTPQVYSSFAWAAADSSPPATSNGLITNTDCANGWVCIDRDTGVKGMVGFHNYVGNAPIANWTDDGANFISFSRGQRGFLAMNNASTAKTMTVQTGLAPGRYCDIIHGVSFSQSCTGPTLYVNHLGRTTVRIAPMDAVAFTALNLVTR